MDTVNRPINSHRSLFAKMGRVRTKTVKKSSRQVIERYYSKMTLDFHTNKKILEEVDKETIDMLAALGMSDVPGLVEVEPQPMVPTQGFGRGGGARRFLS
ncbi:hypothetical protein SADUNF_Sadunf10G0187900 [Salix dunnii]|uniref:Uncharacterized protein n=1 Tax=Salix dunnii TaxID=1413687 RepID=A0A835JPI4_9ROSI|nr:hypothetical protein SADUNF_Sadunf10G0187900 [Salix dunnii]